MKRPDFIKNVDEHYSSKTFSYPGDVETFGTGCAISREVGLKRIAVNHEVLEPGARSSWPHAHSADEELIYILEGHPQVWVNGHVYDLKPGDVVGFPPGTGHSHCLINNTNMIVKAIVVGDVGAPDDKVFYPKHPKRNEEIKGRGFFWENPPEQELGPHDGWPDKKRPK